MYPLLRFECKFPSFTKAKKKKKKNDIIIDNKFVENRK